jgi:hypothetical protein
VTPTIRPATRGDVPALSDLARRTWSDAFGDGVSLEDEAAELEESRSETHFDNALNEQTILLPRRRIACWDMCSSAT